MYMYNETSDLQNFNLILSLGEKKKIFRYVHVDPPKNIRMNKKVASNGANCRFFFMYFVPHVSY